MDGQYFVGIGTMRCATSWVGSVLEQHPEIYFSPIKELHYFNHKYHKFTGSHLKRFKRIQKELKSGIWSEELDRIGRLRFSEALNKRLLMNSDASYKEYFMESNGFNAFGEITPLYSLLPVEGFANIKALFPEARIIFGMRHPANRIWSHWSKLKKKKTRKKRDIKYYSDNENILEFMKLPCVSKITDYRTTLDSIFNVFDKNSILLYFYEDIFSDEFSTRTFLTDLFKFLRVSEIQIPNVNIIKEGKPANLLEIPEDLKHKITEEFKPTITGVRQRIGHIPDSWLG